ncbi:MAG: LmbE family protein, partial [Hymenobacter sp.]
MIQAASGVYVEAIASASTTVSGGTTSIAYEMVNRSGYPIKLNSVTAHGDFFPGDPSMLVLDAPEVNAAQATELGPGKRASGSLSVKSRNSFLISQPYWLRETGSIGMYKLPQGFAPPQLVGKPENEPVYTASFHYTINGGPVQVCTVPVQYKHTDPTLGELYQPLVIVPPVMVNIPAARAYVFADQQPKQVPVTLRAGQAGVAGSLALQVPSGWQAEPATVAFTLKNKDDEQTINFMLRPLAGAAEGKSELRAVATVGNEKYSRGIQQIIYPHIPTQTLFPEATAPLVKLNVARGHTKNIGYLMGAGDEVPEALRQLGYAVTLLNPTDLNAERLARYDAVVLGVRAYNTLDRLKTQQPELLKYVENGGTMLVQYVVNRGTILPEIGPY